MGPCCCSCGCQLRLYCQLRCVIEVPLNDVVAHSVPLAATHVPQASAPHLRLWVSVVERDVVALLKLYGGEDVFARGDAAFQVGTWDKGAVPYRMHAATYDSGALQ